jgi:2',3'-cyclic-nucleotide 2'-phosphodiesterase (5'-nucleotidase family)
MRALAALTVVSLIAIAAAGHEQTVLQQPHIEPPKGSQFRELIWGDMNFLHTTDTHGWYAGHLNQKQYSGDWGDFISFTKRVRERAEELGADVVVVDTGDKHDGNGLSDATAPNGLFSTPLFNTMDYDLVTLGNHELYTEESSTQEYETSVAAFGEKYVSTNVEYQLENGTWVPFGNKYRYFRTPNSGSRILALSFLFDFRRFNSKTRVTQVCQVLQQSWFDEILNSYSEKDLDYIIVYGHIPVTDPEQEELLSLHIHLRRRYPNLVIQYFGGHSHIRDFAVYDQRATGLQSGRYCETVGWISINTTSTYPRFYRRYIDFNRGSFKHHVAIEDDSKFDTDLGVRITDYITKKRHELNLTYSHGYVPESYLANKYPYGHPRNVYTLLNSTILPTLVATNCTSPLKNRIILVNSGSIRYDLYKGNFTKDTEFIVSPFKNNWNVITLPKSLAVLIAPYLNRGRFILQELAPPEKHLMTLKQKKTAEIDILSGSNILRCPFIDEKHLKMGLTTHDDHGCDGDDVVHNSIPYYPSPNIIDSYVEGDPSSDQVDVVFYDFIQPYVLEAIDRLNTHSETYTDNDVRRYGGESTGVLLRNYFSSTT